MLKKYYNYRVPQISKHLTTFSKVLIYLFLISQLIPISTKNTSSLGVLFSYYIGLSSFAMSILLLIIMIDYYDYKIKIDDHKKHTHHYIHFTIIAINIISLYIRFRYNIISGVQITAFIMLTYLILMYIVHKYHTQIENLSNNKHKYKTVIKKLFIKNKN